MSKAMTLALGLSGLLTACTHYGVSSTYGSRSEIGRRLVGAPMVETVSSANVSAGFAGASASDGYGGRSGVGGFTGGADSVQRTHCIQQAQIDYVQPVDTHPVVTGRALDVAGAVVLGVVGLAVIGAARSSYSWDVDSWNSDNAFYLSDPSFFPSPGPYPSEPTGAYTFGAGISLGGAAWLVYSLATLPKGVAPPPTRNERRWTETSYVEASGCGLVPGDPQAAPPPVAPASPY